jgi:NarL family two-component system response regulator LiaR
LIWIILSFQNIAGQGLRSMLDDSSINILIVDDHVIVRRGVEALLEMLDDFHLVGKAASGAEAISLCGELHPDVVLMDLMMPDMDGITAIRALHQQYPEIQVIALTSFGDQDLVRAALEAGASGYLLKNVSARDLVEAIRAVHVGQPVLGPEAARALIQATTRPPAPGHDLTGREHEVLALMVEGLNNTQIAQRLSVSPFTVKNHVSSILAKLGVATRTEAATLALQHNIVQLS